MGNLCESKSPTSACVCDESHLRPTWNESTINRRSLMKRFYALLPLFALSGCVYMQDSHTHRHGTRISKEQAALVEVGKTDKEWVLKNLGTPDRIHSESSGLE